MYRGNLSRSERKERTRQYYSIDVDAAKCYYESLFKEEPDVLATSDIYKILHISKRRAKFLLDNGYIPCIDTGKKTRRYQIKMSDVQEFIDSNVEVDYSALPWQPL